MHTFDTSDTTRAPGARNLLEGSSSLQTCCFLESRPQSHTFLQMAFLPFSPMAGFFLPHFGLWFRFTTGTQRERDNDCIGKLGGSPYSRVGLEAAVASTCCESGFSPVCLVIWVSNSEPIRLGLFQTSALAGPSKLKVSCAASLRPGRRDWDGGRKG